MLAWTDRLKANWKSGVTVSLVSLPLSISLGIAAGATPLMGVITAIWAGVFGALLAGSNYNIVGPTGALSGILASYALLHGVGSLSILAVLSGLLILIVFLLHWERYIIFIPASVIHGFTLGVGFIIALNQLNFALGLNNLPTHKEFLANVIESFRYIKETDLPTFLIFLAGFGFLFMMAKFFKKIPGSIVLAVIGVILGYLADQNFIQLKLQTLFTKFGDIPAKIFVWPDFSFDLISKDLLLATVTVALIAILETLISAKIADGMTHTKHDQRKEILALGVANVASGLCGGIPATAALARTALNIKSGANHKTSALINSLAITLIALVLLPGFKYLPLAIVASILVFVAVNMVKHEHFINLYNHDKAAFFLSLLVALITIAEDPILGILIGATVALLIFANTLSHAQGEITLNRRTKLIGRIYAHELKELDDHGDMVIYRFAGQLTYINAQEHRKIISQISDKTKTVILSFRNLFYVDIDGLEVIEEIIENLEDRGKKVGLSSINTFMKPLLKKTGWYKKLHRTGRVFESASEALKSNWGI